MMQTPTETLLRQARIITGFTVELIQMDAMPANARDAMKTLADTLRDYEIACVSVIARGQDNLQAAHAVLTAEVKDEPQ